MSEELARELVSLATRCRRDPVAFVKVAFPWGSGELAGCEGPDVWQRDVLDAIGTGLLNIEQAIQIAISTGHGTGKSTLVSWLILWAMVTCDDCRGVVTANTESQLRQKTWAELAKWFRLCLWREWFTLSATALHSSDPAHQQTWRMDAVAWSERSTEAFAGLHNQGKRILVVFDESSGIPDVIWETTEGALTDSGTEIIWVAAGNPTRNTGRFRECFGRFRHRWDGRQIDARQVKITNKAQIQSWIDDFGEDSDFVRVRVRGVFPRAGSMQFISSDLVEEARKREAMGYLHDPLIMGVDVGRQGDDQTVICFRKGRDARSFQMIKMRIADLMAVAARVHDVATQFRADAVFVDGGGVGAGVVDRLRQLGLPGVHEVQFGGKADRTTFDADATRCANKRAEMWAGMRAWLAGGAIPDDPELIADLTSVEFGHDAQDRILLERKQDMKRRGLASPDCADALALTFAYPVSPSINAGGFPAMQRPGNRVYDPHNPFGHRVDSKDFTPWH